MGKKTLKQKINCVKWSAIGFAIIYFIIGAIIKSDGWNLDRVKTYELFRDSLTLTAYFLAPVAAFVLFSDWRTQHKSINNEKNSIEILKILNTDLLDLFNFEPRLKENSLKFNEAQMSFHKTIGEMFILAEGIKVVDEKSMTFKNTILSLQDDIAGLFDTLFNQVQALILHDEIAEFMDEKSCEKKRELTDRLVENAIANDKFYENITRKTRDLKPLSV